MQELINKSSDAVLRRRSMRQPRKQNMEKSQKGIDKSEKLWYNLSISYEEDKQRVAYVYREPTVGASRW